MSKKDYALISAIGLNFLLLIVVALKPSPVATPANVEPPETLALRELTIIDDNGKTRIRLSSEKTELADGSPRIVLYGSKSGRAAGVAHSVQLSASETFANVWMQNMPTNYLKLTSNGVGGVPAIDSSK